MELYIIDHRANLHLHVNENRKATRLSK